jgi:ribulose 1,5-bisphosphate synthetase/thiazole synthase
MRPQRFSSVRPFRILPLPHWSTTWNRLSAFSTSNVDRSPSEEVQEQVAITNISKVGIVGGGLAGLSTAYHLLQKQPALDITILDVTSGPGEGGASAVAGG